MPIEGFSPRLATSRTDGETTVARPIRPLPVIAADGIYAFRNRNILLLQGPVGPFFARLAQDLRWAGANVHKVNFNGGDWLFYSRGATPYRGRVDAFPDFLETLCRELRIEVVMLFGDCRPVHQGVRPVAERLGLRVEVFEEGYIRPDYITMETHGVNGNSALPRSPIFFLNTPAPTPAKTMTVGLSIWHAAMWAFIYYAVAVFLWGFYPHYHHHRPLHWFEGLRWVRGTWRKLFYRVKERGALERLTTGDAPPFFLVPLQVHNDAQVGVHSEFGGVKDFIAHVATSFARHAPPESVLVLKHHPMDRPYSDYTGLLRRLGQQLGIAGRIVYIHDQHLPTLLNHARGVITINSTTGISAIHHGCPTLALGDAIYRIEGMTAAVPLDEFWCASEDAAVQRELYRRFRNHLIHRTQINGNFYRRLTIPGSLSGLNWARGEGEDHE